MTEQEFTVSADETQGAELLAQTIIDEMKVQGFLGDFTDKDTGETLLEIQLSDQTLVCNVNANGVEEN